MPSCIIEGCPHKTGHPETGQEGITLHVFPKNSVGIKQWLQCTGQNFTDIDSLTKKILDGKVMDLFRLCSVHFLPDCYTTKNLKRKLKKDAIPSIFPSVPDNLLINEKWVMASGKQRRPKKKDTELETLTLCRNCKCSITDSSKTFTDASCQTDSLDWIHVQGEDTIVIPMTSQHVEHSYISHFSTPVVDSRLQYVQQSGYNRLPLTFEKPIRKQSFPKATHRVHSTTASTDVREAVCTTGRGFKDVGHVSYSNSLLEEFSPIVVTQSKDPAYNPFEISYTNSEFMEQQDYTPQTEMDHSDIFTKLVKMKKLIVFESCLDDLLLKVKCLENEHCNKKVITINKEYKGSAVIVRGVCENGHRFKIFESQPKLKRYHAGNVLLSASIICSGQHFSKVSHLLNIFGLQHFSQHSFRVHQRNICFPAIQKAWKREKENVLQEIGDDAVAIAGDGLGCSTDRSAKYSIYTVMELLSKKVIDFEIVPDMQCSSSSAMQNFAFEKCMSRMIDNNLDVIYFASDRHVSITKTMQEKYGHVDHQYDVRHFAKNVCKKLRDASKEKPCASLRPWIDQIIDHFWWSVLSCDNDAEKLVDNWLSVMHHVINEHEWLENGTEKKCSHVALSETEEDDAVWLQVGNPAYERLQSIVHDKELLDGFKHLTWCCDTEPLKEYHRSVLKHQPKSMRMGMQSIKARTVLAALANNYNADRQQATVLYPHGKSGELGFKTRKIVAANGRNVYESKQYDFLTPVLVDMLKICAGSESTLWRRD
ncbi:uncharacterized protein [Hyperolius riggenbachi]|uniref:uncharacterized protein n=1 Tax=Hyperolius riggenbachi TaxID=752182 RepID=UPI0035A38D31